VVVAGVCNKPGLPASVVEISKPIGVSMDRLNDIWRSLRSLPLWVQIWVAGILVPVNVLPFFLLDTRVGVAGALAALVVVATNGPLMWIYRGMNKVLSIPHLIAWGPLEIYLLMLLAGSGFRAEAGALELGLAVLLVVVNGISLAFDVMDSAKWVAGDRATPGVEVDN
jgi:hypothetical protein